MTFSCFILASVEAQNDAIRQATQIATRNEPPCHYTLLQLNGFYIELVHDDSTHRTHVNAFENLDKLDPYLAEILLP